MAFLGTAACAAVSLFSGCQHGVSGRYIGKDAGSVYGVQLVKTPDNRITGQLDNVALTADGNVRRDSVILGGAVDGANVVLTATMWGLKVFTLSGNLEGNRLALTGAVSGPITLVRADASEFDHEVEKLNAKSRQILAERAAEARRQHIAQNHRDFIAKIDQLTSRMEQFEKEADLHLSRFPGGERNLHEITAKMQDYVNRERQLAGNPNASVARSQLSVAATQASLGTDQLNLSIQSLRSSLQSSIESIGVEAGAMEQACNNPAAIADLSQVQIEEHKAACDRLSRAGGPYRERFEAVKTGLSRLEQIYAEERRAQDKLLETAKALL